MSTIETILAVRYVKHRLATTLKPLTIQVIGKLQYNVLWRDLEFWRSRGCHLTHMTHPNIFTDQVHRLMAAYSQVAVLKL